MRMRKVLNSGFFDRPTRAVAKDLLGKFLVRRVRGKEFAYMIIETEAYDGFNDKASHASRGRTSRNMPMFGPAGHWYVYFTYGMHWMLNAVTREKDYPAAVLIRAGLLFSYSRELENNKASGPGRLTKRLRITGKLNGEAIHPKNGLWVEDRGVRISPRKIIKAPRVGVDYSGPIWSAKPWRYRIKQINAASYK